MYLRQSSLSRRQLIVYDKQHFSFLVPRIVYKWVRSQHYWFWILMYTMPLNIKIQKVYICPSLADLICRVWGNTMCPIRRLVKSSLSSKDQSRWVMTHTDTGNQLVYSPQATRRKCQDPFLSWCWKGQDSIYRGIWSWRKMYLGEIEW